MKSSTLASRARNFAPRWVLTTALLPTMMMQCVPQGGTESRADDILFGTNDVETARHNAVVELLAPGVPEWCTGTLISATWVLTASHCVGLSTEVVSSIHIGNTEANADAGTGINVTVPVDRCVLHPLAEAGHLSCFAFSTAAARDAATDPTHDLALLHLGAWVSRAVASPMPVVFRAADAPVPNPAGWINQPTRIVGYGAIDLMLDLPTDRQTAASTITEVTTESCPAIGSFGGLDMLGLVPPIGHSNTWSGDSGSPLLWTTTLGISGPTRPVSRSVEAVVGDLQGGCPASPISSWYTHLAQPSLGGWVNQVLTGGSTTTVPTVDPAVPNRWDGEAADGNDNCPGVFNPDQYDSDGDGRGDACDICPTVAVGDEPLGVAQPNCNAMTEQVLSLPVLGDACDPYPCDWINDVSNTYDSMIGCTGSGNVLNCSTGSNVVSVAYGPRISTNYAMPLSPSDPPILTDEGVGVPLVTPLRRCACWRAGMPSIPQDDVSCYATAGGACPVALRPNGSNGYGWYVADLNVGSLSIGSYFVNDSSYSGQRAATVIYNPAAGRAAAAAAWQTAIGSPSGTISLLPWTWFPSTATNLLPPDFPSMGTTNGGVGVMFWTRAQTPSYSDNTTTQQLQDSFTTRSTPVVASHNHFVFRPISWTPFWTLVQTRLHPPVGPGPYAMEAAYVGRYLPTVAPLTNSSPAGVQSGFFANGAKTDAVRGLIVGIIDVRQALITTGAYSTGSAGSLPIYARAVA